MKRIYLNGLKKVLTPRELKNVLGGSGGTSCNPGKFECVVTCVHAKVPLNHGPHTTCLDSNDPIAAVEKFCLTGYGVCTAIH